MKKILYCLFFYSVALVAYPAPTALQTAIKNHDVALVTTIVSGLESQMFSSLAAELNDSQLHIGLCALSYACYFGHSKIAGLVLQAMQRKVTQEVYTQEEFLDTVNAEDNYGWTAYLFAVRHNLITLMELLQDVGATIVSAEYNRTRLMVAAVNYHKSHPDFLDWLENDGTLLEQTNEQIEDPAEDAGTGRNVLMMAVHANPLVVPVLCEQAANENVVDQLLSQKDQHARTAFMYACMYQKAQFEVENMTLLQFLFDLYVAHDIDILDEQDDAGMTALMYAAQNNDVATITALMDLGANTLLRNHDDELAIQLATTDAAKAALIKRLTVTSESFQANEEIPTIHGYNHENYSPQLSWGTIPDGTESFAIIVEDFDTPVGTWTHWVIYNIPADVQSLDEHVATTQELESGAMQGLNDYGQIGYGGPFPPSGVHSYVFTVYALDTTFEFPEFGTKQYLLYVMQNHIIAQGTIVGTYQAESVI